MNSENEKDMVSPENESKTENNIYKLQEMINEALKGRVDEDTGESLASGLDSGHVSSASYTPDPSIQSSNMYSMDSESSGSTLTLGKLYSKFRNLDFRLTRVEEIILKREDLGVGSTGKKRVTKLSGSGYHGVDPGYVNSRLLNDNDPTSSNNQSNDLISINPILTSSNHMMTLMDSIQNRSTYSLSSKVKRIDEIKRSDLDHYCLPLLESNPKPSTELMEGIVDGLSLTYPNLTQKQLLSKVREWFRKRREYMSQRIFQVCAELYKDLVIESEFDLEAAISELERSSDVIDIVLKGADLEITDNAVAREYCHEKILSYFNSLYRPSMLKNRQ